MFLSRRKFVNLCATAGSYGALANLPTAIAKQEKKSGRYQVDARNSLFLAPEDPKDLAAYREALVTWRTNIRRELNFSDALYHRDDFDWTSRCYCCGFIMLCDLQFYNAEQHKFTVDAYLGQMEKQFGGLDAAVLWHAYPWIGIDDRNQYDYYRDQPGGMDGLKNVVHRMHERGVKAFINYNPWDTGTRREEQADLEILADFIDELDADGIFLDTMRSGPKEFRGLLDGHRKGVALESEIDLPLDGLATHHLSWAQYLDETYGPKQVGTLAPGILRNKWVERRHMMHNTHRWMPDHTSELHLAWMNGVGMLVWENVFGSSVPWSARDKSLLRTMLPIQRRYADLFAGQQWTPLVEGIKPPVYGSHWQDGPLSIWTLVNRSNASVESTELLLEIGAGDDVFDLVTGQKIRGSEQTEHSTLPCSIPPRGIACILSGPASALGQDFGKFLKSQATLHDAYDGNAKSVAPIPRRFAVVATSRVNSVPPRMAEIPATSVALDVAYRNRECGFYESSNLGEFRGRMLHRPMTAKWHTSLRRFAIDRWPVTNADFAKFLNESGHRPRHEENFLKHWQAGAPPAGLENHPVVYIDLDDARAYARWAGKRLPTEFEWQYAAQGPDRLAYPWGSSMEPGRCNEGKESATTPVDQFPKGVSKFGCWDMCGNVWEWTESEHADENTRFAMLKGGSFYRAHGSGWYFDGGPQPNAFTAKVLLAWPGINRCRTVGFRCAMDLEES